MAWSAPRFSPNGSAARLTSLCGLPQALTIRRTRETRDLALIAYAAFAVGVALCLVYGVLIGSIPVIMANAVTLVLLAGILSLKLRFGEASGFLALHPWDRACLASSPRR
mgnify:CR=1 FL=1